MSRSRGRRALRHRLRQMPFLVLFAFAGGVSAQGLDDLDGAGLFARFCASCHGASGQGDGPVASSLATSVPDLTRIVERNDGEFPAGLIRETIDGRSLVVAHGTRFMPVWGYEFWIEEGADATAEAEARGVINRLVEYLRSIQAGGRDTTPF
jgi:mono/diheme cytochrome c family protein